MTDREIIECTMLSAETKVTNMRRRVVCLFMCVHAGMSGYAGEDDEGDVTPGVSPTVQSRQETQKKMYGLHKQKEGSRKIQIHTCIHTRVFKHVRMLLMYMHTCKHVAVDASIHAYVRTQVHARTRTYTCMLSHYTCCMLT